MDLPPPPPPHHHPGHHPEQRRGGEEEEEEFSQVVASLLLGLEELKQSLPPEDDDNNDSTTTTTTSTTSTFTTTTTVYTVEHALAWQAQLNALLPALDRLARWTCDVRNPQSVQSDLFRHAQDKLQTTARRAWHAMMTHCPEPSLDDDDEDDEDDEHEHQHQHDDEDAMAATSLDDRLRAFQGAVAQTTEINLRLLYNPPDLIRAIAPPNGNDNTNTNNNNNSSNNLSNNNAMEQVVQDYVAFQRTTLRLRVKPTIAKLIQQRQRGFVNHDSATNNNSNNNNNKNHDIMAQARVYHDDDDDHDHNTSTNVANNNNNNQPQQQQQQHYEKYHANAMAHLLGQAATLLQPLQQWQATLPPLLPAQDNNHHTTVDDPVLSSLHQLCRQSMIVLDQQAQQLAQTISTWFFEDRTVDRFLVQQQEHELQQQHAPSSTGSSSGNNSQQPQDSSSSSLALLDGLVDEMSLACLLLAQYQNLIQEGAPPTTDGSQPCHDSKSTTTTTTTTTILQHELLPEWSFKYASLERWLALQQWQRACVQLAQPISIVLGSRIYVPSVVEDATYLSTRALERAASTLHPQAIGTVALQAVAHTVWSTDDVGVGSGSDENPNDTTRGDDDKVVGVFQALLEERGCWIDPEQEQAQHDDNDNTTTNKNNSDAATSPNKNSNNFTSALLDALDQDLGQAPPTLTTTKTSTRTPPRSGNAAVSSGNFLSALTGLGSGTGSGSGGMEQMRLMQMQAKFCVLNGLHAASGACQSLVEHLDELLLEGQEDEEGDHPLQPEERLTHPPNQSSSSSSSLSSSSPAHKMIQLAREELVRYSGVYTSTLRQKARDVVSEYCIIADDGQTPLLHHGHGLCLDHVACFVAHETYDIATAAQLQQLESDERLEAELMVPLREYLFLPELASRSEATTVLGVLAQEVTSRLVTVLLTTLWQLSKPFSDWGSLLFSKQVRLIQSYIQECVTPPASATDALDDPDPLSSEAAAAAAATTTRGVLIVEQEWERLTQVVAILQMEKPAEWLLYTSNNDGSAQQQGAVLTPEQVLQTMKLRVDFSHDTIASVVERYSAATVASSSSSSSSSRQPPPLSRPPEELR